MSTMFSAEPDVTEDFASAIEYCHEQGWTDGLPVIPPTQELVEEFLAAAGWQGADVLAYEPVRGRSITAEKVVANAIMAGCKPGYLPVVKAALASMSADQYVLHGTVTSTGGAAPFILVNGPIRAGIGINSSTNLFGPGNRANSSIGRAIRLVLLNCLDATPGTLDRSTQGNFGKYSGCFGENEELSPWPAFHTTRGLAAEQSAVTVFAGESGHNILMHGMTSPEQLLDVFVDVMRSWGSFSEGESLIVMAPEHAKYLADRGWSREMVADYLYENVKRPLADLKRSGKLEGAGSVPEPGDDAKWVHRGHSPADILIAVGGGEAGGHSAFFPSWSRIRGSLATTTAID
ncbi:hypothetical protein AL755_00565 (plasmid) [Arthrobacter sp. ERGS1:01]|uniref:hypothetical protein n=1 Tax=Arthrobacter sp. ERGS1:01 TaxID=1704044 RepID=UPI0006B48DFB|nr:hypothetical protein [Arthrobacter sp. ERGS1:01]ALE04246.1 hypothetical protein AL755_00565 [Arthrobacter sp. ERGS1:01]